LAKDGLKYRGFLYFDFMPQRGASKSHRIQLPFGIPNATPSCRSSAVIFAAYVYAAGQRRLQPELLEFRMAGACASSSPAPVILPHPERDVIRGLEAVEEALVITAAPKQNDANEFETNGGRVLAVSAQGRLATEPRQSQCDRSLIHFDGIGSALGYCFMHFD